MSTQYEPDPLWPPTDPLTASIQARLFALSRAIDAEIGRIAPIIAEEEAAAGRMPHAGARFFLVDPIDGAKEFLNRNGDFTINIALIENSEPVCGVVYAPALGLICAGEIGLGARMACVEAACLGAWRKIEVRQPDASGSPLSPAVLTCLRRHARLSPASVSQTWWRPGRRSNSAASRPVKQTSTPV